MKQELKKEGLKASEVTSRRDMIAGRDKAFVFVSGVSPASPKDLEGFYLGLVLIFSQGLWFCPKEQLGETFLLMLHHRCRMCLEFLGVRFHCLRSFLLIWCPKRARWRTKVKVTRNVPASMAVSSEAILTGLRRMVS